MPLKTSQPQFVPRRELGRTRFKATLLGIGDLADRAVSLKDCVGTVHRAMDAGLNVIDTAPGYEDGYSEQIVGKALKGRRDGMFVIDKIDRFPAKVAPQVEASLKRLKMDHVDLFVFHGLSKEAHWAWAVGPGGGMEQLARYVEKGQVRFRGISSHNPVVLIEAIKSGLCDVVMFPAGPFGDMRYVEEVLPLARQRKVGTVCFKVFGAGKLLGDTSGYGKPLQVRLPGKSDSGVPVASTRPLLPHLSVFDCLSYTLTCDPDVALLGLSCPGEQDVAFEAARNFVALTGGQMADIHRRALRAFKNKGPCWWDPPGFKI